MRAIWVRIGTSAPGELYILTNQFSLDVKREIKEIVDFT